MTERTPWSRTWAEARATGRVEQLRLDVRLARARAAVDRIEADRALKAKVEAKRCPCGSPVPSLSRDVCPPCARKRAH